jgi:hypothetical protein
MGIQQRSTALQATHVNCFGGDLKRFFVKTVVDPVVATNDCAGAEDKIKSHRFTARRCIFSTYSTHISLQASDWQRIKNWCGLRFCHAAIISKALFQKQ